MPIDPQSIASIGQNTPDIGGAVQKAYTLSDAIDRTQMNKMTLASAQEEQANLGKLKSISSKFDLSTAEGQNSYAAEAMKIDPKLGMQVQKSMNETQRGALELDSAKLAIYKEQNEAWGNILTPAADMIKQGIAAGKTPAEIQMSVMPLVQNGFKTLQAVKLSNGASPIPPEAAAQVTSLLSANDPNVFIKGIMDAANSSDVSRTKLAALEKERMGAANIKSEIATREENAKREAERLAEERRHHKAIEGGGAGGGKKPPAGYMWDPENEGELKFIPGGPKDPTKSSISGRESVMFGRVVSSANEAVAAIQNIVELPLGASSGVLGVGGSAGHGILSSTKAFLTNEVASQDVQDYNTMLAGVRRNLATIETVGLAPSGALTEGFGSLELRAGDTEITKMRKLAEMRQVVEKGLEPNLQNPRLPQEQKDLVQKIIGDVKKAVPFTVHDVTSFQRSGKENKGMTLTEYMAKTVAPPAASGTTPVPSPATGGTGAAGGTQDHGAAMQWAQANPNDPRAQAIMAKAKAAGAQ